MTDILDKLADLYKQATEERSHNYTGAVIKEAITHIAGLRALAAISQRTEPQAQCSTGTTADAKAMLEVAYRLESWPPCDTATREHAARIIRTLIAGGAEPQPARESGK